MTPGLCLRVHGDVQVNGGQTGFGVRCEASSLGHGECKCVGHINLLNERKKEPRSDSECCDERI